MGRRLEIEDCIKFAESKGAKFLSKEYINTNTKYEWQCENEHVWRATFHNIKSGYWCPHCAGLARHTVEHCIKLAESNNGKFLSTEYANCNTKYEWQCHKGHIWETTSNTVQQGSWCPKCAGVEKHTIDDNSNTKYMWRCEKEHVWIATAGSVKNGSWCQECRKVGVDGCISLAELNGGKFLSNEYISRRAKYEWQCSEGHTWCATSGSISRGSWCPMCSSGKAQKKLYKIIEDIFPKLDVYNNYRGFDWLKTAKGGKQEIDIWIPHIKLAIEYDGEQHFIPVRFGGVSEEKAADNLENMEKLDKVKNRKMKKHSEDISHFIRFNYTENLDLDYVKNKIFEVMR